MMKTRFYNILLFLALLVSMVAVSCTDDSLIDYDPVNTAHSNLVRFDVSSGFDVNAAVSRSAEDETDSEGLDPVVLSEGTDTLYLHRYVAPEHERATGRNPIASRAAEVNTIRDFLDVNGGDGFRVMALYEGEKDPLDKYFDLSKRPDESSNWWKATPLQTETDGDVWYVPNLPASCRYWPEGQTLRFNAFAPASVEDQLVGIDLSKKVISFEYKVPVSNLNDNEPRRDAEVQPDIMFASNTFTHDYTSGTQPACDKAPLNFRHALSAIKFAVRDVAGELVDITISGVAGSGRCTFNPDADPVAKDKKSLTFAWDNLGEVVDYTQTFNYTPEDKYNVIEGKPTDVVTDINAPEKTFMLIPQSIPDDAELIITFKKKENDNNIETKTLRGKLKTVDIPLWEAGKEYIYTISTSSENWFYYFEVTGSSQNPSTGEFSNDNDSITVNPTVTDGAYYKVLSYRQRANNPNVKEPVAWTAQLSDGQNGTVNSTIQGYINKYQKDISMSLSPSNWWINHTFSAQEGETSDVKNIISNPGSTEESKYDVIFKDQYVATDWEGDWKMRANPTMGTKDKPIDLSMQNGGTGKRNTANCYIVNRGGWYAIPLVYGNAVKDDGDNKSAYTNHRKGEAYSVMRHTATDFVNHDNKEITTPYISGADNATLLWEDALNIVDSVQLMNIGTEKLVAFKINQEDLQQSNSIIAVRSGETILWSWHIWVCEHWFEDSSDNLVLRNDYVKCDARPDNEFVTTTAGVSSFEVAPCNLGWCDAKNVIYLNRTGSITFTQTGNPKSAKPQHTLNVKQREKTIDYWIGNNTYYQWGRKDPMIGFVNSENQTKASYGPFTYDIANSRKPDATIGRGIKEPHHLLIQYDKQDNNVVGNRDPTTNDWITTDSYTYYNLWNNYAGTEDIVTGAKENNCEVYTPEYAYSAVKTVYDPSPVGFVVPPSTFYNIFANCRVDNAHSDKKVTLNVGFNGTITPLKADKNRYFIWKTEFSTGNVIFYPTGQRWDKAYHIKLNVNPGENMNPHIVYLWTNNTNINTQPITSLGNSAYCFALGPDEDPAKTDQYLVSVTHFNGRKSMARPIRSVKEYQ